MIANLTRGAKTASLHLPAARFQIAGVLSYLDVDRLDDYELPCEGQDSSGIMVSLEPTGIAERNIAELCRNEKISLGRLNSGFRSLFKLPYEQQLGVMERIANQKPEHFDDFRKTIDAATVPSVRQEYYFPLTVNLYTANRWGDYPLQNQCASKFAIHGFASKSATHHMMTSQFRSERRKEPFGKPNGEKTGDFERFLPFFRP